MFMKIKSGISEARFRKYPGQELGGETKTKMMSSMSLARFGQYPRARIGREEGGWIPQLPQLPYNC